MSAALFVATATATAAPRLFVAGCGYVGLRVANEARARGYEVSGSVRNAEKAENLRAAGFDAHIFDLDDGYTGLDDRGLAALASATHVLATVPPVADFDRDPLLALHGDALAAEGTSLRWAGYLSTTSVYGDHGGGWVDERAETRVPAGGRAAARLQAEREWLELRARAAAGWRRTSSASPASTGRGARRCTRSRAPPARASPPRARRGAPTTTRRRRRCSATSAPSAPTGWRPSTSRESTSPTLAPRSSRRWRRPPRARAPPCTTSATTSRRRGRR